jgi:hypothetical protein
MTAMPLRDFTDAEKARLDAIEAAPAAEESFDATAALRRVLALADEHADCCQFVAIGDLRRAVAGD